MTSRSSMTPEEKIEALREWAHRDDWHKANDGPWWQGMAAARRQVRAIIDPPVPCNCGDVEDVRGCTLQRAGVLHTEKWCDECCPHGVFLSVVCEQCPPPTPKWRALVDEAATVETSTPLPAVLRLIATLADPGRERRDPSWLLARIVAICEAEVGDGWRADPSGWVATPALHALLRCVAGVPTGPGAAWPETDWQGLANAASAWLRDLTDGAE